jgi:Xaa-Pro aminopeptidase
MKGLSPSPNKWGCGSRRRDEFIPETMEGVTKLMVSNQEMERRWKLVRQVMNREGLDWLICGPGHPNGYAKWLSNRPIRGATIAAFPIEGDLYFATHGDAVHHTPVDSYGVKHLVSCAQPNLLVNTQAPVVLDAVKSKRPRKIGFLGMAFIAASTYETFVKGMPDVEFVDATDLIVPIKAVKSEEELIFMKRAAELHDMAVEVVRKTVRPGITANDVVEEVRHAFCLAGSESQNLRAGSAPPATVCKYVGPGDRKITNGDQFAMLIECSEPGGYFSEMMPTVCIGKVPKELQRVFDDVLEALKILADLTIPGADPMKLLKANDDFMKSKGYPAEARLAGHCQGVDLVERPALSPLGETIRLQANMVISLHPTVHGEKAWGFPVNQSFLMTEDGLKSMTKTPQEIILV